MQGLPIVAVQNQWSLWNRTAEKDRPDKSKYVKSNKMGMLAYCLAKGIAVRHQPGIHVFRPSLLFHEFPAFIGGCVVPSLVYHPTLLSSKDPTPSTPAPNLNHPRLQTYNPVTNTSTYPTHSLAFTSTRAYTHTYIHSQRVHTHICMHACTHVHPVPSPRSFRWRAGA